LQFKIAAKLLHLLIGCITLMKYFENIYVKNQIQPQ